MEDMVRDLIRLERTVEELATREFSTGSLVVFVQTADKTVANTTNETSLLNTTGAGGYGLVLPANFFTVGQQISILMGGHYSTGLGAPTLRIKITLTKAGPTTYVICDTTANTMTNGVATRFFGAHATMTCRSVGATGTVMGAGVVHYATTHTASFDDDFAPNTSPVTVDTTAALTLDVTATWGAASASNTITGQEVSIVAYK